MPEDDLEGDKSNLRKYEYQRLAELTLYFLDYRLKIVSFSVALNGAGLAVVFTQGMRTAAMLISLFGLGVAVVTGLLGLRANALAYRYRAVGHKLERHLGLDDVYGVHCETFTSKLGMGRLFSILYALLVILWIAIIILLLLAPGLILDARQGDT